MTISIVINLILSLLSFLVSVLKGTLPAILVVFAGLTALAIAIHYLKFFIYLGAFGATFDHMFKPKWKGYKVWRSQKWNLNHMPEDKPVKYEMEIIGDNW